MSASTADEKLLTTEEAAGLLKVRPQTLCVWRSSKRHGLPYIKVGGCVRYRMGDLLEWLQAQTVSTEAAEN